MTKLAKIVLIVGLLLGFWGVFIEPSQLMQRNVSVELWPGPKLKIAFFSDLHAGSPHITEDYIKDLVQRINAMAPDIILIGGDLLINGVVGGSFMPIDKVAALLKELKAPLGVFATLGNHDWWNDGELIIATLVANGIVVLENQARHIHLSDKFSFWLVGIGDSFTDHANTDKALSQITSDAPRILFMHDPAAILKIRTRFFLTLAGHLHGGQIFVPGFGAIITHGEPREWANGWTDFALGSLFVSKGIGTSILPIRINAPPEFVILDLNAARP